MVENRYEELVTSVNSGESPDARYSDGEDESEKKRRKSRAESFHELWLPT